jgi:hypothetical protein
MKHAKAAIVSFTATLIFLFFSSLASSQTTTTVEPTTTTTVILIGGRFIDNSDGTVTDAETGLMWQQATAPGITSGEYTWQQTLDYCENLDLGTHTD